MTSDTHPPPPGPNAARILVVDDEPYIREAFQLYLETQGYDVSAAEDGTAALTSFRADPVDVVLLDLVMPGMQGLELLRRLKKENPFVEVIIATGCGSMNSAIEALRLGAFDYVTKPILDFERDLLAVVRAAVHQHHENTTRRSEPSDGSIPVAVDPERFHQQLEALAEAVLRATTRDGAFASIESFFRSLVGVTAGVLLEADRDGEYPTPRLGWGRLVEPHTGGEPDVDISTLVDVCRGDNKPSWTPLLPDPARSASPTGGELPKAPQVEVWRIPLGARAGEDHPSRDLLLFRPAGSGSSETPPRSALLTTIVELALTKEPEPALS